MRENRAARRQLCGRERSLAPRMPTSMPAFKVFSCATSSPHDRGPHTASSHWCNNRACHRLHVAMLPSFRWHQCIVLATDAQSFLAVPRVAANDAKGDSPLWLPNWHKLKGGLWDGQC
jgi:hypothetical protein